MTFRKFWAAGIEEWAGGCSFMENQQMTRGKEYYVSRCGGAWVIAWV